MRNVLVIGGSRYFGKSLVELVRAAGDRVTVVNRGSSAPPPGVGHVVADRGDEAALTAALGGLTFDVVLDQVAYHPADAAVAARVFGAAGGRAGRYVMTSTMEVYDPATSPAGNAPVPGTPVPEGQVDPAGWAVDEALWRDPARVAARYDEATAYAEGKRQAEAVLTRDAGLPFVSVRSAHVVGGGALDFTGRLAHYVERIATGRPVVVHRDAQATSFVGHDALAAFLFTAAGADFTGPVNAAAHGAVTVQELCALVAARVGRAPELRYLDEVQGTAASPYSFDRYYAMDTTRARHLGAEFGTTVERLTEAIDTTARELGL